LVLSLLVYRLTAASQKNNSVNTIVSGAADTNVQQASMDIESMVGRPAWPISIFVRWIDY
jgi:hypothetical protein